MFKHPLLHVLETYLNKPSETRFAACFFILILQTDYDGTAVVSSKLSVIFPNMILSRGQNPMDSSSVPPDATHSHRSLLCPLDVTVDTRLWNVLQTWPGAGLVVTN